jgi:two-component system sensor histidine kinase/response regulator
MSGVVLPSEAFGKVFPFFVAANRELIVQSVGPSLTEIAPQVRCGDDFVVHFALDRPKITVNFEELRKRETALFLFRLRENNLVFRTQVVWVESEGSFLFLASPQLQEIEQMRQFNLKPGHFPVHDPLLDHLLALQYRRILTDDLTRLNAELAAARDTAVVASRLKSDFLSSMSHEIRTPMNGVVATADLLLGSKLNFQQRDLAETLRASSQSLLSLLNGILDYSKIENSVNELESVPCDFVDLAEEVVELFWAAANAKGIGLKVKFSLDQRWRFLADPGRLRQVISNLVGNAVKFTAQGSVTVGMVQTADNIRIQVKDTGMGFDNTTKARLFKPFSQADANIQRRFGGTGLGLAICKKTVELWGGEIDVDSEPGRGTCFWFDHPLRPCEDLSATALPEVAAVDVRDAAQRFEIEKLLAWMGVRVSESDEGCLLTDNTETAAQRPMSVLLRPPITTRRIRALLGRSSSGGGGATSGVFGRRAPLVLLVEDNAVNRKVGSLLLRRLGCQCDIACDGSQAVQAVEKKNYSLVLMDKQMPVMDGLEATRQIRKSFPPDRLTIIALTASSFTTDRDACLAAGMNDYMTKPIDARSLETVLARWGLPVESFAV